MDIWKKKISKISLLLWMILLLAVDTYADTFIYLIDVSGSSSMQSSMFRKNLRILNQEIDTFKKNDAVVIWAFRSHELAPITDFYSLPDRNGARSLNILKARQTLRGFIQKGFAELTLEQMGDGTDCVGALIQILLFIKDRVDTSTPVKVRLFSDGLQTIGVGSLLGLKNLPKQEKNDRLENYFRSLEQKMDSTHLNMVKTPFIDELRWYGMINGEELNLTAYDLGRFESRVRALWQNYLEKELDIEKFDYLLRY